MGRLEARCAEPHREALGLFEQIAGKIFQAGVHSDSSNDSPGAELAPELQRGDDVQRRGRAGEDALFPREPPHLTAGVYDEARDRFEAADALAMQTVADQVAAVLGALGAAAPAAQGRRPRRTALCSASKS